MENNKSIWPEEVTEVSPDALAQLRTKNTSAVVCTGSGSNWAADWLIGVLREMSEDIDTVIGIDFNQALKALTNGK